jgi:hypothetical protein
MKNKVYTVYPFGSVLAGGNTFDYVFQLDNVLQDFKLKSILYDIRINETAVPYKRLPLEVNTTQNYYLNVNVVPVGITFARIFTPITIPGGGTYINGAGFSINKPGQYLFDSFCISKSLQFYLGYTNTDALINYSFFSTLVVEIEDNE